MSIDALKILQHGPRVAVFTTVARLGSFTSAARELRLSKSTISAHIRELEDGLGVRLLERSTRVVRLTQDGQEFLERATSLVQCWSDLFATTTDQSMQGRIRATANHFLGRRVMIPAAERLAREHSDLQFEIHLDDRRCDLVSERFDLALRVGPLEDASTIGSILGRDAEILIASPRLLERFEGIEPDDLANLPWVGHSELTVNTERLLHGPGDRKLRLRNPLRVTASSAEGLLELVERGLGVALMPKLFTHEALGRGTIAQLLPQWRAREVAVQVLYPSRRQLSRRLSAFIKVLCAEVSASLAGPYRPAGRCVVRAPNVRVDEGAPEHPPAPI